MGAIVEGSRLVATIPAIFAAHILELRPKLRAASVPFPHALGTIEMLWPKALDVDPAVGFVREAIMRIGQKRQEASKKWRELTIGAS